MKSIVEQSHDFLVSVLHPQAICVDATLGRGKDTLFFLKHNVRKVVGFEIQKEVFDQTISRINDPRFQGILDGHQHMDVYIQKEVDAMVFNFGYCPNIDSMIQTKGETSVKAVSIGLGLLKKKGRMALVIYPHENGKEEAKAIEDYLEKLDPNEFYIEKRVQLNRNNSPYLIGIEKKKMQ